MPIWISWILIILGIFTPILYSIFMFKKYFFAFTVCLMPITFLSAALMLAGISNNPWILTHVGIGNTLFIISFIEISLSFLVILFFSALEGIKFLIFKNLWDEILGFNGALFIRFILIIVFMLLTSFMFYPLYGFWAITATNTIELGIWDTFYYALTVVYGIPQSGVFEQFQHGVNSYGLLRTVEVTHIIFNTMIEFLVIGLIIGQILQLINSRAESKNKKNTNKKHQFRNRYLEHHRRKRKK